MTNNKVIIDGVDVSKCEYMYNDFCYCDMGIMENGPYFPYLTSKACCSDNLNCYYKQFQRKTQECEKLREQLASVEATGICEICQAGSVLEVDKLRKIIRESNIDKAEVIINDIHQEVKEVMLSIKKIKQENEKLKSALEEIEKTVNENCGYIEKDCNFKNILRIINKAKEQR